MFKPTLINEYQEVPKEALLVWVKLIIDKMHKELKNQKSDYNEIQSLFKMYEDNLISVQEIRKKAFDLHQKAREANHPKDILLYRIYGQALSSIHVRTHAFHVANYILKLYDFKKMDTDIVFKHQIDALASVYEMTYQKQDDII